MGFVDFCTNQKYPRATFKSRYKRNIVYVIKLAILEFHKPYIKILLLCTNLCLTGQNRRITFKFTLPEELRRKKPRQRLKSVYCCSKLAKSTLLSRKIHAFIIHVNKSKCLSFFQLRSVFEISFSLSALLSVQITNNTYSC